MIIGRQRPFTQPHPYPYIVFILICLFLLGACSDVDPQKPSPTPIKEFITKPTPEKYPQTTPQPIIANPTPAKVNDLIESEKLTITFAIFRWEREMYTPSITVFETNNPDIHIEPVYIDDILLYNTSDPVPYEETGRKLALAADVVHQFFNPQDVEDRLFLDLRPFIVAEENFDLTDFNTDILAFYEIEGGLWALPSEIYFECIFYNKDIFDAANQPYPQAGWTWAEFLATAQALTIREGNETSQWGFVDAWPNPYIFIRPRSGSLTDTTTDPPTTNLNSPAVIAAVRWYSDLYLRHQVTPYLPLETNAQGYPTSSANELIDSGQVAMWVGGMSNFYLAHGWQRSQLNIGIVPMPISASNDKSTLLNGNGYTISAFSQQPDAAWRWLNFLSRQEAISTDLLDGPTGLPARQSLFENSAFWSEIDPELDAAIRYALDHAYIPEFSYGDKALYTAITPILEGEATVEEALSTAQISAETAIANRNKLSIDAIPMPNINK